MSIGAVPPAVAEGVATAGPRRKRWWLRALALGLAVLLIAAVVVLLGLGATYQPVRSGDSPANVTGQIVSRRVNNFAAMDGQIYIPAQRPNRGAVYVSLTNTGSYSVTIESATLNNPDDTAAPVTQFEPLRDSGPATYWRFQGGPGPGQGTRLAGAVLRPGQMISIRLPVTTAGCWMPANGYAVQSTFWVRVKFLFWTHLVEVWWTSPFDQSADAIIAHQPEPASQGGLCPH